MFRLCTPTGTTQDMFRPLYTPTGTAQDTKYAWSAFLDLCTPTDTAQDTTITQSMPGQHVWTSSHSIRHSTGHHNHTKYALSACSDLSAHCQAQHGTPQSHKVCLVSMFRPLCTPTGTSQSHKVWHFRAMLHSKRLQQHQCHSEPKPCHLLWRSDWVTSLRDCVTVHRPQPAWTTSLCKVWNCSIGNQAKSWQSDDHKITFSRWVRASL